MDSSGRETCDPLVAMERCMSELHVLRMTANDRAIANLHIADGEWCRRLQEWRLPNLQQDDDHQRFLESLYGEEYCDE
jgi:hypothetical protein